MLGIAAISEVAICELPLPFVPPPIIVPPNIPGGAIIYAIVDPTSNRLSFPLLAPTNPSAVVSLSKPNPSLFVATRANLSDAEEIELVLTSPSRQATTIAQNVFAGQNDIDSPKGIFRGGYYAVYVLGQELNQAGGWSVSVSWTDGSGVQHFAGTAQFYIAPSANRERQKPGQVTAKTYSAASAMTLLPTGRANACAHLFLTQ